MFFKLSLLILGGNLHGLLSTDGELLGVPLHVPPQVLLLAVPGQPIWLLVSLVTLLSNCIRGTTWPQARHLVLMANHHITEEAVLAEVLMEET